MAIFTLVTWNMQGGNADKWSKVFGVGAGIKCLQECSSPHSQFTNESHQTFRDTNARTVILNYEATGYNFRPASKKPIFGNLTFSDSKPTRIDYRDASGHTIYVTKFATYGAAVVQRYVKQIEETNQAGLKAEEALIALRAQIKHDVAEDEPEADRVEQLKNVLEQKEALEKRVAALANRVKKIETRKSEAPTQQHPETKTFRFSRCNTSIAYKANNVGGIITHLPDLAPVKPEFQRHVQCLEVDFGMNEKFIIFNIHAVASGSAWSYLNRFIPQFDFIADDADALAWLCLGDFNVDAGLMTQKLAELNEDEYSPYPHRKVFHTPEAPTHFSRARRAVTPASEGDYDGDLELYETLFETMSENIQENSPELAGLVGRNLDYMIVSTPIWPSNQPEMHIPALPLTNGFLSDHRPVAFEINTAQFQKFQETIMIRRQRKQELAITRQMRGEMINESRNAARLQEHLTFARRYGERAKEKVAAALRKS